MRLGNVNPANLSCRCLRWLRPADDNANQALLLYQWVSSTSSRGMSACFWFPHRARACRNAAL